MFRLLDFLHRNERHISTLVFVGGFITDILTFTLLDIPVVNLLFLGYLGIAAFATFVANALGAHFGKQGPWWKKAIAYIAPLAAQFCVGGLLSGCLIFYTKSADVFVSWPFLVLLAVIFIGNEYFRDYRSHLVFQTVLFFFGLYAYLVFAIPLYVNRLGPRVFLESTAAAAWLFALFLAILALIGWQRFKRTLIPIAAGSALVLVVMVACYFTGAIPPLPLTLKQSGVYYGVSRQSDGYHITYTGNPRWSRFVSRTVAHQPGTPLYVFSSIFAPTAFSAGIVHEWDWYDPKQGKWVPQATVAFNLTGGREAGYRGYSLKNDPQLGKWRVRVETMEGQVIGTLRFTVENTSSLPALQTAVR